jgi:MFS transporter, FHS family, L-fucose permease
MTTNNNHELQSHASMTKVLPVMFGFFIMGFVDLIGIAINYVKSDLALSDSLVNLISLSCFLWFFVLSIPTGLLMNRIGRKDTVLVSFAFTFTGLLVPLISYSFTTILIAFGLIGIGNTIIQVALNPLVINVVSKDKLTGTLTLGQFVKAISSLLGPILASWLASAFLEWKYIFPIYAAVTFIATLWLWSTSIEEGIKKSEGELSFGKTLSLLKNRKILAFFIGILILVGVDVGINTTLPKYLMEKSGLALNKAILGNSVYFFVRTISAFVGGVILMKFSERIFFKYSVLVGFLGLISMLFFSSVPGIIACVVIFGIGYANLFSIIFSLSLKLIPERANEISSLLIVGVSGGAIITPLLGISSDFFGSQLSAIVILVILWIYMIGLIKMVQK